jgi:hypothetical protein
MSNYWLVGEMELARIQGIAYVIDKRNPFDIL